MDIVDVINHSTVAWFIKNCTDKISSNMDNYLAGITDGASSMKKTVEGLQVLKPKLTHVTCLALVIYQICVVSKYQQKTQPSIFLVETVKRMFNDAPSLRYKLGEKGIPIPKEGYMA